ncbi:MAG: DUF5916 domain-containing protein [Fidelibacterota bacterium]
MGRIKHLKLTLTAVTFILTDPLTAGNPSNPSLDILVNPILEISKTQSEIRVDGELNDAGWQGATSTDMFLEFQPGENVKPPVDTQVMVTYDDDNLYVAFLAFCDPNEVRASYQKRDEPWGDDFVAIVLDTYGDATSGIMIASNPFGIQMDTKNNGNNEDQGFDVIYESRGKITADGYQVEMAIPFSSLSFPKGEEQNWRVSFYRSLPRSIRHQIIWGGLDLNNPCWLCQLGYLKGLQGLKHEKAVEFLPALVGSQASDLNEKGQLINGTPGGEVSLGIKYGFSSNIIGELTLNPDFSQVEADADQIDVNTTFALFYPEKRAFFNEGSELFNTWIQAIYTRSINNPLAAGRVVGQAGKNAFSFLTALDETSPFIIPAEEQSYVATAGRSVSNIFRYRRSLDESNFIGALVTDRRLEQGGSGTVAGVDTRYRFNDMYQVELQTLFSQTAEPNDSLVASEESFKGGHDYTFNGEQFSGNALEVEFSRDTKVWELEAGYNHKTPGFRADNGFITRNNTRRAYLSTFLHIRPNGRIVSEVLGGGGTSVMRNFEGETKRRNMWVWMNVVLPRQFRVNLNGQYVPFERFKDTIIKNQANLSINIQSQFSKKLMFGFGGNSGRELTRFLDKPENGAIRNFWFWGQFKVTDKFIILPEYNYSEMKALSHTETYYSGYVARLKLNYQFNHDLSFRLVGQYNDFDRDFDFQPLLSYQPSPFTIFYIGASQDMEVDRFTPAALRDGRTLERQYFLKFQYLFRS